MKPLRVAASAFWSPPYRVSAGGVAQATEAKSPPPAELISSRFRRYTSELTRMAAEVFETAATASGYETGKMAVIFGSSQGEIGFAVRIISAIRSDWAPSPAMFMNSVHNTAPAHLSIATGNMGFFTSIAAGSATPAMCFLEASMLLESGHDVVALVVADEALPSPMDELCAYSSLACAFVLTAEATRPTRAVVSNLRPRETDAHTTLPADLARNPCAGAALLAQRIEEGSSGAVLIGTAPAWTMDCEIADSEIADSEMAD